MPALQLKVEGRGNGIKTKIVNLNEVATALRVPPACNFFSVLCPLINSKILSSSWEVNWEVKPMKNKKLLMEHLLNPK